MKTGEHEKILHSRKRKTAPCNCIYAGFAMRENISINIIENK